MKNNTIFLNIKMTEVVEAFVIYEKLEGQMAISDWTNGKIKIFSVVKYNFQKKCWFFYNCEKFHGERTLKTSIKNNMLLNYLKIINKINKQYRLMFLPQMFQYGKNDHESTEYTLNDTSNIKECINLIYQMPR